MPSDSGASTPPLDALADHVHPFDDADESTDSDPLADVVDEFADATVVGLGECCHGVDDFERLRARVFERLVHDHGVRLFALEAHLSEACALDDYVVHGTGSVDDAIADLSFWVWRTEALREFVEWLREFNRDRPVDDRVRFHGVDVQSTRAPAARVDAYLDRVDPAFRDANASGLRLLREGLQPHNRDDDLDADAVRANVESADEVVPTLVDRFDARRDAYVDATSDREYAFARRHVHVLDVAVDLARIALADGHGVTYGRRRDPAMAENVRWLLDVEPHDSVAVVAANGHLRTGNDHHDEPGDHGPLGYHLDDDYGDEYYALALEFGTGSVRTLDVEEDAGTYSFPAQELDDPPGESLPGALRELTDAESFVDVAAAARSTECSEWLAAADSHGFGPVYDADRGAGMAGDWRLDYSWEVDGLCFVPEASPARLLDDVTDGSTDGSEDRDER